MSEVIQNFVSGKMIDGILYVEATDYQLSEAKHQALLIEYDALRTAYQDLKAEFQIREAYKDEG